MRGCSSPSKRRDKWDDDSRGWREIRFRGNLSLDGRVGKILLGGIDDRIYTFVVHIFLKEIREIDFFNIKTQIGI